MTTALIERTNLQPPLVVGYLARVLPTLSETFVVRELVALRRLGVKVTPFSLHAPSLDARHPEAPGLGEEVEVLFAPRQPMFWLAHLYFLLRAPRRYCACLWHFVMASGEPWRRRLRSLAHFLAAPFAAWKIRRAGVTHLHAHFANAAASVALFAAELAGIPFSFTAHAYDLFVDDLLLAPKLRAASFVATCSEFNVRYLRSRYPEATGRPILVVRYGIDPQVFLPRPHHPGPRRVILGVGRLVETKGFHTLIQACARLRALGITADCRIVGEGPETGRLTQLIGDLGLSGPVSLLGKLSPVQVKEWYPLADMLVMPSCVRHNDRDGIPNVLIEAMAMEVPVISTRVSGIPELVRDGETGLLVEPDEPEQLADAMARLLQDPALAQGLAKAGRDLVTREYDIARSARTLGSLFKQSAAGHVEAP